LVIKFLAGPMAERKYRERVLQGEVMTLAEHVLTAMPLVQAFGRERHEEERFRELAGQTLRANLRSAISQEQFKISTGAFSAAATAIAMLVGGTYVLAGSLTVGSLLVLITYFNTLYSPLETLAYLASGFATARAGSRRVLEILQLGDEGVPEAPDARLLPARPRGARGQIRLDNVTFGYRPGHAVLHEVTLEALPGQTVALVGHTGAGKSTVLSLLARLYDPWQGAVLFDGMDLRAAKLASLRSNIAVLLQEPFILPLTIAENIAYGRPEATAAEIVAAAEAAQVHTFIERLPRGYATMVGERGVDLSGGRSNAWPLPAHYSWMRLYCSWMNPRQR
jgi:ATP-binding cassette subfamily B protein/subfamily B ATP-binding cassette protein MsbA